MPSHFQPSDVFNNGSEVEWELCGRGLHRQILGFDEGLMLVRVRFDKGAVGELHQHEHRQVSYVESGLFEVEIDEEKQVLEAGDCFFIPPHAEHGAVALRQGTLIDVFAPARKDMLENK